MILHTIVNINEIFYKTIDNDINDNTKDNIKYKIKNNINENFSTNPKDYINKIPKIIQR